MTKEIKRRSIPTKEYVSITLKTCQYDYVGDIDTFIAEINAAREGLEDATLHLEYDRGYYDSIDVRIEVHGTRPYTQDEINAMRKAENERIALEKKKALDALEKKKENDYRKYLELKAKYEDVE